MGFTVSSSRGPRRWRIESRTGRAGCRVSVSRLRLTTQEGQCPRAAVCWKRRDDDRATSHDDLLGLGDGRDVTVRRL